MKHEITTEDLRKKILACIQTQSKTDREIANELKITIGRVTYNVGIMVNAGLVKQLKQPRKLHTSGFTYLALAQHYVNPNLLEKVKPEPINSFYNPFRPNLPIDRSASA